MKYLLSFLCCLLLPICQGLFAESTTEKTKIKWQTNYENALQQAKTSNKPIILFFTGSDWCGWCTKLEDEILNSQEFNDIAADKFIFVRLDFPLYSSQDEKLTQQNKQLQKKYEVRSFPTLVIINTQEQQMGISGYRPGGGAQFAEHLFKIVQDYNTYQHKLSKLNHETLSGKDLKGLYNRAREYHLDADLQTIIAAGSQSENAVYFLVERYRKIAEKGQAKTEQAKSLKQRLLNADPNNEFYTHYKVALIDFETICEEAHAENLPAKQTIQPLQEYISVFGDKDKDNAWRLEMIISQVYLEKNQLSEALKHARASYERAPSSAKNEIAQAVKNIELQLH